MLTDEGSAGQSTTADPVAADLLDPTFVPVRAARVARADLDGETVLWHPETGITAVLDPIGSVLWECFDGSGSIDEIAADLSAVYGVDVATIRTDVLNLVRELGGLGLLEGVAP
ncbi:MAG TPA: PqqD family protein, partial [Nitriliruptorales bacterium]|nr:PqqD family protein [Nitriliruptorales bacterium]